MLDIKNEYEKILVELEETDVEILEIAPTGSQLFRGNPNDLDYLAIVKNFNRGYYRKHINHEGLVYDLIIKDETEFKALLSFDLVETNKGYIHNLLYNYFVLYRKPIYSNWEFVWDIFKFREDYLTYLKIQYTTTIGKRQEKIKLTKTWVHYYIPLKIFSNNSTEITYEMWADILTLYEGGEKVTPIIEWIEATLNEI